MTLSFTNLGSIREVGSRCWSNAELVGAIGARAGVLEQMGVGHQSTVALVHGNSAQFFVDLFAVWARGAAAACLDPALTGRELKTVIGFLGPEAVLCGESPVRIGDDVRVVCLWDVPALTEGDIAPAIATGGNPALILFTSGTTAVPKGVVLSFDAVTTRIGLNIAEIGKQTLARTLLTLPTYFGHGLIGNALTPLFSGGELVIPAPETALHKHLGGLLDEFGITFLTSVPALWRLAMKFGDAPRAGSLRRVHVGSAPLALAFWHEIAQWSDATVFNCYGMTEFANWISGASCRAPDLREGLVGKAWGGSAAILTADGTISFSGKGEIVLRSTAQMTGYLRNAEMTKRAFHGGWFRTGDSGLVTEDGAIVLTGRLKDEINRAGFKVQPAEIDALLASNRAIEAVCAFGLPDTASGEIVAVAIELAPGSTENQASLRRWCLDRARRELVPERWFFVEKIPVTSRGKTDRDKVRKHCLKEHSVSRHHHDITRQQ
jgi:acyl-CoA synthetase (AMP-forming)/AMP-acid ligase II